jgi:hypothetical protein
MIFKLLDDTESSSVYQGNQDVKKNEQKDMSAVSSICFT